MDVTQNTEYNNDPQINESLCPNCGNPTNTNLAFCQSCGAATPKKQKKRFPKKWLIAGACSVAAVALVILLVCLLGGKTKNYTMYIKDKEVFFNNFSRNGAWQATTNLFYDDLDNEDIAEMSYYFSAFCNVSDDGRLLFFTDKIDYDDYGYSLYCRSLSNPKEEPVKISSNVSGYYYVNEKATIVTYTKGEDRDLYQYSLMNGSVEKIASDVDSFIVSNDGKKIFYINSEDGLYVYYAGKDKEKIASDVSEISYITDSFDTIYYLKEDSLYRKVKSEDSEKIASDVQYVLEIYEDGSIYFTKESSQEIKLIDFVYDDMKEYDANLPYPVSPSAPDRWDYDTYAEYSAAYDVYREKHAEYRIAYSEYQDMLEREELREELKDSTLERETKALYYYDGEEIVSVSDNYSGLKVSASDSAVIIFNECSESSFEKVNLSDIYSVYSLENLIEEETSYSYDTYIAVNAEKTLFEQTDAQTYRINSKGDTLFFVDDVPDDESYGVLYQVKINNGKVGKAELYDSDVYAGYSRFISEDQFMYFKDFDYDKGCGEMYINKNKIDFDVDYYSITVFDDGEKLVYFTDWNEDNEYGTLKVYEGGKVKKIRDDVYTYELSSNGDVLYLYDYSDKYYRGDLYAYNNGKSKKIDIDVVAIIPVYRNN